MFSKSLPEAAGAIADELLYEDGLSTSIEKDEENCEVVEEVFQGEGRLWSQCKLVTFLEDDYEEDELLSLFERVSANAGHGLDTSSIEIEEYENSLYKHWKETVLKTFEPIQVSPTIRITPVEEGKKPASAFLLSSSASFDATEGNMEIFIEPGFAFGSGQHETTRMCLRWLQENKSKIKGNSVVDYGSGSGVLAIASLLLGAKRVVATDIEEESIFAIALNTRANGIEQAEKLEALLVDHEKVLRGECRQVQALRSPFLVANILMGPLVELEECFASIVESQGEIALSGILAEQVAEVQAIYSKHFSKFQIVQMNDWALLSAVRKES